MNPSPPTSVAQRQWSSLFWWSLGSDLPVRRNWSMHGPQPRSLGISAPGTSTPAERSPSMPWSLGALRSPSSTLERLNLLTTCHVAISPPPAPIPPLCAHGPHICHRMGHICPWADIDAPRTRHLALRPTRMPHTASLPSGMTSGAWGGEPATARDVASVVGGCSATDKPTPHHLTH